MFLDKTEPEVVIVISLKEALICYFLHCLWCVTAHSIIISKPLELIGNVAVEKTGT